MDIIGNADLWLGLAVGFVTGMYAVISTLPPKIRKQLERKKRR